MNAKTGYWRYVMKQRARRHAGLVRFRIADDRAAGKNSLGDPHRSAFAFVLVDGVPYPVRAHRFLNGVEERLFPKVRK
jgi:hypothetical protein